MPSRFENNFSVGGTAGFNLGTGTVTLAATPTINVVNPAVTFTIGGPIVGGANGLTKDGPGLLLLTGSSTYTGLTTVSSGTLRFGDDRGGPGPTGSVDGDIANNSVVVFNRSNAQTYGGVISGTGTLTKLGSQTLTLTGENTFTGVTNVSAGTLEIGNGGTTGSFAGNISNAGAVAFNRSDALTYGGTISGAGTLTKQGAGTLTLTGSHTYSGVTTVSAGTLDIGGGGTTGWIGTAITNNATVAFNRSDNVTYASVISGSGNLTKQGAGTLTLTGANTFTGTMTVSAGTLQIGAGSTAGSLTGGLVNNAAVIFNRSNALTYSGILSGTGSLTKQGAGTLTITGANTFTGITTVSSGTLLFGRSVAGSDFGQFAGDIVNNATVQFSFNNNTISGTYGGVISGTGTFIKHGSGTLTLTGANTFTSSANVVQGTLEIGNGGTTGSIAGNIAFTGNATSLTFNRSDNLTYGGTISDQSGNKSSPLTKLGAGTLTLTGSNTYTGATTVSAGTLDIGGGGTTGWIGTAITNNATVAFNRSDNVTYTPVISGSGNLTKLGSNTLTLNGASTFSGTTTVSGGGITLGNVTALQNSGIDTAGSGIITASSSQTSLTIGGLIGSSNFSSVFTTNLTGITALTLQPQAGRSFSYSGVIENRGSNLALTKSGSGEQILTGLNTFSGSVTISQGTLTVDKIRNSGSSSPLGTSGTITFNSASAGILRYTGAGETTNRFFNLTNAASVTGGIENNGTGPLVISSTITGAAGTSIRLFRLLGTNTGTNQIVSISGTNVSVEKSGPGTWWLTGASTYTGTTTVLAGTLQIGNGSTGGSIVGNIVNSANVVFDRSDNLAYAGIISGTGGLTKRGAGQLTLNGASTFTGPMTIAEGTVNTGIANALSGSSAITIGGPTTRGFLDIDHDLTISNLTFTGSGGDVANGSTGQATFLAASGTAVINVLSGSNAFHANATLSSPTLVDVANGAYFSFHNNLFGSSSLTKSGAGTMNLTGDNDTLSGNLFVTGGMVTIGTGMNQIGTGTTTLSGGATIDLGGQSFTDRIVVLNGTILNAGGTATTTTIEGQSAIDGSAAGTYNITSTGSAVFNATVGSGTSFVNVNVNTGAGSGGRATFAAAVGTNGNIVVENGGSAAFQSTVAGSVISHGVSSFAGNVLSTSEVSVQPGGLASFAAGMAGHANVDGTAFFSGAVSGTAEIYGSGTFGSTSSLTGKLFTGTSATALLDNLPGTISAAIHNDGQLRIDRTSGSQIISGVIIGSGTLTKTGAGQLTLTGENTFHGVTTVSEGTLQIGNGGAVGSIGGDIANNAAVVFNRSNNLEYAGIISGGGSLTKQGAGRLTLTGQSTFNGVTNVSAGILEISNGGVINSTSGVTVNGAGAEFKYNSSTSFNRPLTLTQGILSGTGTINTAVSVAANAIISPGNSPGSQTYTSSEWLQNGTYLWELNAMTGVAGTNWDQVTITNLLNLTGLSASNKFNLNLTTLNGSNTAGPLDVGYVSGQSYIFPFVTFGSLSVPAPFSNTANSDLTSLFNISLVNWQGTKPSAQDISVKVNSGGTGLDLVIVPEPATIALAAIGIGVAAWALRRRRVTA